MPEHTSMNYRITGFYLSYGLCVFKGVLACNRHMLENQLACDLWFTVGPHQEKIGAHRYVLQSRSGVFFAMLDGPGADRSHIDLPDTQPTVLWQLLR